MLERGLKFVVDIQGQLQERERSLADSYLLAAPVDIGTACAIFGFRQRADQGAVVSADGSDVRRFSFLP